MNKLSEISYPYPRVGHTTLLSTIFYCCHHSRKVTQSHLKGNGTKQLVRLMTCGLWLSIPRNEVLIFFPVARYSVAAVFLRLPYSVANFLNENQLVLKGSYFERQWENGHLTAPLMTIIKHCWFMVRVQLIPENPMNWFYSSDL